MLLRFRQEPIAVTGDTEAMFHQEKIPEKQRNYLRFLWWKDSDLNKDVIDHKMTANVFGGVSSLSCSNYALKRTASDNLKKYGEDVASILRWNFYVNDMLKFSPQLKKQSGSLEKSKNCVKREDLILRNFPVTI